MKQIIIIAALALLVGCSKPTIDSTSSESLSQSTQKVRESLPESKRANFDSAMKVVAFKSD